MIASMNEYIDYIDREFSEKTAFRFFAGKERTLSSVSYHDFAEDVRKFAGYLQNSVENVKGKHIGLLADNSYKTIVSMFGIMLSGAVAVPLNMQESFETIEKQISAADIELIFHDGNYLKWEPKLAVYDTMLHLLCENEGTAYPFFPVADKNPDSVLFMMFTSGTTSASKCVMTTHKNFFSLIIPFLLDTSPKSCFHCMPIYHIGSLFNLRGWLYYGCTITINSTPGRLIEEIKKSECEVAFFPGVIVLSLLRYFKTKPEEIRDIQLKEIHAGASKIEESAILDFHKIGINIYQNYGMTETSTIVTLNLLKNIEKTSSVGVCVPGCQIQIQDGEICISGDCVTLGYYKNPKVTAEAIQDGWLHTGDLGYLDEDGYLYITGRKKNVIILSSGENVSPEELEGLLLRNDAVKEVVVKEKEGKICAEIFCEESDQERIREYVQEVNREVAMYKRITLIEFRTEPFPKTGSGKIKRC